MAFVVTIGAWTIIPDWQTKTFDLFNLITFTSKLVVRFSGLPVHSRKFHARVPRARAREQKLTRRVNGLGNFLGVFLIATKASNKCILWCM